MVLTLLGIIIGILLSLLVVVISIRYTAPIQRAVNSTESKAKPKGSIIEPESEDVKDWVKSLEKDEVVTKT